LRIERDAEQSAAIVLELMQAKEGRVFKSDDGEGKQEEWFLKQLPEDHHVEIDSHSASPAFVDDARELAFALKKVGAIDEEDLIMLAHPPMEDLLLQSAKKRKIAKAKLIKEHPELLTGSKGKKAAA
jgi:hypothetical protein